MKKKFAKAMALSAVLAMAAVSFTGCGTKKVNLNNYLDITYSGYDTVGVASYTFDMEKCIKENPKAFGVKGEASDNDIMKIALDLDNAVDGKLDKSTELSNGDTINYIWNVNLTESLKEKYPVEFVYEDVSVDISTLDKAEAFDPFANLKITYGGIAPNGTLNISGKVDGMSDLYFSADKTSNLKNGDMVTVTVDAYSGNVIDYCAKYGKIPSSVEKEYTVEGLSSYVAAIEEIPDDILEKMKNQALDVIKADAAGWSKDNSLDKAECIGYYFLSPKEGFSTSYNNIIYAVYKVTANITGTKENSDQEETVKETYYTCYTYSNIMVLDDGTCSVDTSKGKMTSNTCKSEYGSTGFWWSAYTYHGYNDLDSMFNDCVTKNVGEYNYESTIKE